VRQSLPILVLLAILGIAVLYAITPRIAGGPERAPIAAALADIRGGIASALRQYKVDTGYFPNRLQDMVQKPSEATNWHGPYLDKLPVDPWGHKYIYEYPGKHNTNGYDLFSAGPDGKAGTGDDIGNWMN
jgi:general secretion pathway protein G